MRADRPSDRGFILATTLLIMTLLTVMLTAAFVTVSAEFRTTSASYATTRALNLAQAGLQQYLSESHSLAGNTFDSTNYAYSGGFAAVAARRLRDSTAASRAIWIVVSAGVDTTGKATLGYQFKSAGNRVVAQMAYLDLGFLPARAAMVAANGVQMVAGGSNPIDGYNTGFTATCTPPSGAAADTFGLTVPSGDYGGSSGAGPGGEGGGINYLASPTATIDSTRIDWAKLVAGEFTPDYTSSMPPINSTTHYSVYYPGNVTIPSSRYRGLLVAGGNVRLSAFSHWDGVIIAGGLLDADVNSFFSVHGMVITGLNISLGQNVGSNRVRRGNGRTIQWDYCYTRASTASLSYLSPLRGSFVDNWKTF